MNENTSKENYCKILVDHFLSKEDLFETILGELF